MPDPRKKPTAIKKLEGNPGRRPVNVDEPQYPKATMTPPSDLDKVGKDEWRRIVGEMEKMGVVTKMDEMILFAYCEEFSTLKTAIKEMRKPKQRKLVMASPSGYPVQNPFLSIKRKSIQILRGLANDLGLSPVARSRVTAAPTATEDDDYEKLKRDRDARLIQAQERFKNNKKKK